MHAYPPLIDFLGEGVDQLECILAESEILPLAILIVVQRLEERVAGRRTNDPGQVSG
jgi:hypothetical protein